MPGPPDDGSWSNDRRETAFTEARAVLDAQNATMTDIDEKAMRTVRLVALLTSVLLAGRQFRPALFDTGPLSVALGLFLLSTIAGITTYGESDFFVGPTGEYIETLAAGEDLGGRWDRALLETYAGMVTENDRAIASNALLLTSANLLFTLGLLATLVAVLI